MFTNKYSPKKQQNPARVINNSAARGTLSFKDNTASSLNLTKLIDGVQNGIMKPDGIVQRMLSIGGKEIKMIPLWLETTESQEVVRILLQWMNDGNFSVGTWYEAIESAREEASKDGRATRSQADVLDMVRAKFLQEFEFSNIILDSPEKTINRAREFAASLGNLQREIQSFVDLIAPKQYKCLARFYVNSGGSYPGLNSWAFFQKNSSASKPASSSASTPTSPDASKPVDFVASGSNREELSKIAMLHMAYGHESGAKTKGSPFVSTTEDVQALIEADGPSEFFEKKKKAPSVVARAIGKQSDRPPTARGFPKNSAPPLPMPNLSGSLVPRPVLDANSLIPTSLSPFSIVHRFRRLSAPLPLSMSNLPGSLIPRSANGTLESSFSDSPIPRSASNADSQVFAPQIPSTVSRLRGMPPISWPVVETLKSDLSDDETSESSFSGFSIPNPVRDAGSLIPTPQIRYLDRSKEPARGVSPIITNLLSGCDEDVKGCPKRPAATHVAFLVVPNHRTVSPPKMDNSEICCIREKEVVVFAPDVDMINWFVCEVSNCLPSLNDKLKTFKPVKKPLPAK